MPGMANTGELTFPGPLNTSGAPLLAGGDPMLAFEEDMFPFGYMPDLEDPPTPGGDELLGIADKEYINQFFTELSANDWVASQTNGFPGPGNFALLQPPTEPLLNSPMAPLAASQQRQQRQQPATKSLSKSSIPPLTATRQHQRPLAETPSSNPMVPLAVAQQRHQPPTKPLSKSSMVSFAATQPPRQPQQLYPAQHQFPSPHVTADDLAAASTLWGAIGVRSDVLLPQLPVTSVQPGALTLTSGPPTTLTSTSAPSAATTSPLAPPAGWAVHTGAQSVNGIFGLPPTVPARMRLPRPPLDEVRFGSDPNFGPMNFVPRSKKETTEALAAQQLAALGCLQRNSSAASTRAPSPASNVTPTPDELQNVAPGPSNKRKRDTSEEMGIGEEAKQPRRRRSPRPQPSHEANAAPAPLSRRPRPRTSPPDAAKRKRPRQTLTDEQKRENHKKSEKRRREEIVKGYQRLQTVVPALQNGSHSRARLLSAAVEWLEQIKGENTKLEMVCSVYADWAG